MSEAVNPESTSSILPTITLSTDTDQAWPQLIWIPYVTLTLILLLLTCLSFMHYHFKNRGKYLDAVYKQNNLTPCPKKYRVTLNRKGFVPGMIGARRGGAGRSGSEADAITHDIFIVTGADRQAATNAIFSGPRIVTSHCYENEAYDCESSQGSEKSLLNKAAAAADAASRPEACWQADGATRADIQSQPRHLSSETNVLEDVKSAGHATRHSPSITFQGVGEKIIKNGITTKQGPHVEVRLKLATVAPLSEESDH